MEWFGFRPEFWIVHGFIALLVINVAAVVAVIRWFNKNRPYRLQREDDPDDIYLRLFIRHLEQRMKEKKEPVVKVNWKEEGF